MRALHHPQAGASRGRELIQGLEGPRGLKGVLGLDLGILRIDSEFRASKMSWGLIQGLEGLNQGFFLGMDSGSRVLGIDSGFRLLQGSWGLIQGLQVLRGLAISLEQLYGV